MAAKGDGQVNKAAEVKDSNALTGNNQDLVGLFNLLIKIDRRLNLSGVYGPSNNGSTNNPGQAK